MPETISPGPQQLLELLLVQSHDYALFLMDPERTVIQWYPGAEEVFGFKSEEMIGSKASLLFNAEDIARGSEEHEFEVAHACGRSEDDRWHVRKDGSLFWASGVLYALKEDDVLIGYAKLLRNRTDLKTQSEALENQVRALTEQGKQKDIFLGVVAHELRNPLGTICNAVELLRRAGEQTPMSVGALNILDRQANALRRLVDDLLDTTRMGAGKLDLQLRPVDLRESAEAAVQTMRPLAQGRDQRLEEIFIPSPVTVNADAGRMQQVFGNLLHNAIKYTPAGGKIVFNITTEGGDAIVRVTDTGVGMTAEILPKIFELFTQEEESRKDAQGGLGLGLALVKQIVELHGGTVQGRSDGRDKGSIFTVRIPLSETKQP